MAKKGTKTVKVDPEFYVLSVGQIVALAEEHCGILRELTNSDELAVTFIDHETCEDSPVLLGAAENAALFERSLTCFKTKGL